MAPIVTLRSAIASYPHVRAVKDGTVTSERVGFVFEDVPNITRAFRRMVRTLDFDLCEIALTTLAQAHAYGKPLTGLPIVVMRGFHHAALLCPTASVIRGPADLRGRRVGVRAWSQTTGVWVRGILRDEYGVDHRDITWMTAEDAHVAGYVDPPQVRRIEPGQDLRAMLLAGEIDAAIGLPGMDAASIRPVIQDAAAAAATELSAEARFAAIVNADVLPYGLEANRAGIELCLRYDKERNLLSRPTDVAALFCCP